ncbi:MAG: chemotaxis protein CheX [Bacteriovoracaceae bacterium]
MEKPYLINEQSLDEFMAFLQANSHKMFDDYVGQDHNIKSLDQNEIISKVYKDRMSFILISGESFNIIFRVFFNSSQFGKYVSKNIGVEEEDVTEELIRDFMNEYCNLVAGSLKSLISDQLNESLGISIPIVTSGFEYLYFGLKKAATHYLIWKLAGENTEAVFCVELEELRGFKTELFNNLENIEESQDEDDIFNF